MKKVSILLFSIGYLFWTTPVYAAVNIGSIFGFGNIDSLGEGVSRLVTPMFSIASGLVTIYFILGAFDYARSGGDKEAVAKAQKMITHSLIGFMLLIFSFFIIQFLLNSILGIKDVQLIE